MIKFMIKTYENLQQPLLVLENSNFYFINKAFEKSFNITFDNLKDNFNKEIYLYF